MKRTARRADKKSGIKIIAGLLLLGGIIGTGYVYTSLQFEREAPRIEIQENVFWNRKNPLQLKLADNVALKNFELILNDGKTSLIVGRGEFKEATNEQILQVSYPKSNTLDPKATRLKLQIVVNDGSLWNFFKGNQAKKTIDIHVDYKSPDINVLANTRTIRQGGSALVIFQAEDENLDTVHIKAADQTFKAVPYKKEGYWAALIAWPFLYQDNFKAEIIATDLAGNTRVSHIPLYLKSQKYKVSWIQATDGFIDGKITDLASSDPDYADIEDKLEKFRAVNETMRLKNEDKIHALGRKMSDAIIQNWPIKKFYPLKNGQNVAGFGDTRHYYYDNKEQEVSLSYHLGHDFASTKMATITASNPGIVVYAGDNGIYGNMPMIDHGLGLHTLYGHCSKMSVKEGDNVAIGQEIGKTGTTGLALGDHLHFGVLVQGVEVQPLEWYDESWIKINIQDVFKAADKIIEGI
ncbi:MAG: M23 family metallopeptidase [Sulfurovum sp.]|nr:M23 family metallopeptidase [Sulfurovum sp.]